MTGVKDGEPDHLLALLGNVLDDYRRELGRATAGSPMPPAGRRLRSSQLRLLSLTPDDGLRLTDLARRAGMTKQALGEFADDLEARGLLESVRDPADRRVRILRPTRRGRQVVQAGAAVIDEVEARWRERLGPRRWDQLRRLLEQAHESAATPQGDGAPGRR